MNSAKEAPRGSWSISDLFDALYINPCLTMLWGDVGSGKTTLALQLAKNCLASGKKAFFLNTKQSAYQLLYDRILGPKWRGEESDFIFCDQHVFLDQLKTILSWTLYTNKLERFFGENKVGLLVVDEIANSYLLEMGKESKNEKLNEQFITGMATLVKISKQMGIPVLLTNTFSLKDQRTPSKNRKNGSIKEAKKAQSYETQHRKNDLNARKAIKTNEETQKGMDDEEKDNFDWDPIAVP